jgi:hypothetical protein
MTKVIIASPAGSGRFDAYIDGRYVVTSASPFIDACRVLVAQGADPDMVVVMRHAGSDVDALRGRLGDVAGVRVHSAPDGRPKLATKPIAAAPYRRFKRPRWAQTPKPGADA